MCLLKQGLLRSIYRFGSCAAGAAFAMHVVAGAAISGLDCINTAHFVAPCRQEGYLLSQLVLKAGNAQLQVIKAPRAACGPEGVLWQGFSCLACL